MAILYAGRKKRHQQGIADTTPTLRYTAYCHCIPLLRVLGLLGRQLAGYLPATLASQRLPNLKRSGPVTLPVALEFAGSSTGGVAAYIHTLVGTSYYLTGHPRDRGRLLRSKQQQRRRRSLVLGTVCIGDE